ncbi:MAG: hypothetical protein U9N84_12990 [Actinomycetota bacterium]|nr:hypothetical protein [Actinomycetota bacterium]
MVLINELLVLVDDWGIVRGGQSCHDGACHRGRVIIDVVEWLIA